MFVRVWFAVFGFSVAVVVAWGVLRVCCGFGIVGEVLCIHGSIMYTMHGLLPFRFACVQRDLVD